MAVFLGSRLIVRTLEPLDLEPVCAIESKSGPSAWSRRELLNFVRLPAAVSKVLATSKHPADPIAFFVSMTSDGVGLVDMPERDEDLYVANLAVAPRWRRQGVGSYLLEVINDLACERGLTRVTLDVQEENLAAQLCYKKAGFRAVRIRPRMYPGTFGRQDGYRMERRVRQPLAVGIH